ncbi:PDZ and LIM domain protein Zasp-like, partial [Calliphora vicina]|uniref:PDZ and LIM domain protein Zasp-like n=1 Tax=Calliphora vicina TaxID=7373 RepID=UPI00325AF91C
LLIEANEEGLQPQYAECYFEEDFEVEETNRQQRSNFCWPPAEDDSSRAPTAAPLYIAPPETQHVVAKPLENPPPPPPGNVTVCGQCHCSGESEQQQQLQIQQQQQQQSQWQSRSAPQLTSGVAQLECESGSDSYTSTSTTTTTTSEEYQRMYAAQVQAYQMQQAYEQSGSEFDYHMDMEVAAMQQQDHLQLSSSHYSESGRRSAQECIETLVPPLSTYRLVDMVREVTPSPVPEPSQGSRHVVFLDDPEVKEEDSYSEHRQREEQGNEGEEKQQQKHTTETQESSYEEEIEEKGFVKDDRSHILESQRIFQPTPEIKFEIAPVKQIPPTKIPNPCPKEWINPMVRVLTTAPETPFHMVGCLCPKPCECTCQVDPEAEVAKEIPEEPPKEPIPEPYERPPSPEPEPVHINTIWDTPTLSKAMTIAPEFELKFAPPASEGIPLPEETEPYMPPPTEIKPYVREDYRPKTPLLRALTTAPEKPFEAHFDRDVPIHILDLPTPKEHLSMKDALRTAPERPYTPLDPENATHMFEEKQKEEEKKKTEFQVLDREEELGLSKEALEQVEYYTTEKRKSSTSAFAAMQAFQPSSQPLSSTTTPRHSISYTKAENDLEYKKYYDAHERYQKRRSYFSQKEQELLQQQQTNTTSQLQEQQQQQQTNTREESSLYSSTKASTSSSNSFSAVQQQQQQTTSSTYASNLTQATKSSQSMAYATAGSASTKVDVQEIIEEVTDELEHSEVIFPPPSPLSHLKQKTTSGLHRPDSIPKYQRNWTVLPTQSPARTPEPPELRENIPLAFVDTPKTPTTFNGTSGNTVHKPVAQMSARSVTQQQSQSHQQQTSASAYSSSAMCCKTEQRQQQMSSTVNTSSTTASDSAKQQLQLTKPTIPIIVEDRSGPVTMAFQALDEHMVRDQSQTPSRPYTPSMINKPAPITPYYQTPEKLCFDECPATHARDYDRRSASPFPDRARSPAPGPPPNPLAAIRAPRMKETEVSPLSPRVLQAGSITTGQSYLGAQQAQQQERLLSHTATGTQSAMQSFTQEPEKREKMQIGNMTVERSEKASRLEEQKQSQMQSHTKTQVGNTQIERRRKVTEEFEHTSSAKTVEIRTGSQSTTERRQSYGKTGYVANQARRLSGLEQEITNLTSQSQAISARAATLTETKFPELHSEGGQSKFPTKPVLSTHDEPQQPSYYVSGATTKKLDEPACTIYPPAQQTQLSTTYGASLVSAQQSQSQQQQKSLTTLSTTSCSHQQKQQQANTVSCSLTKASATTCTNNQAYQSITAGSNLNATSTSATTSSATGTAPSGVCPVTGTFCRPGHTCCKQQLLQSSNNNGSRPTASLGTAGCKPPHAPASSNI